jgi:type II secretory pathway pseudopilin PulG
MYKTPGISGSARLPYKRNVMARAVTLVELLVVLLIVAAVSALVLAAIGPAREKARIASCAGNLHQMAHAFTMYIQDYGGIEPVVGQRMTHAELGLPPASIGTSFWKQYGIDGTPVLFCPSQHYSNKQRQPKHRYTSYQTPAFFGEREIPGYQDIVAHMGPQLTLVSCEMHNESLDWSQMPKGTKKKVQSLKLNMQVVFHDVPAQVGSFEE